jgi:hypothetical protein
MPICGAIWQNNAWIWENASKRVFFVVKLPIGCAGVIGIEFWLKIWTSREN